MGRCVNAWVHADVVCIFVFYIEGCVYMFMHVYEHTYSPSYALFHPVPVHCLPLEFFTQKDTEQILA